MKTSPSAAGDLLLPAGTRLLHIGPPKTGTSTLQAAFHARRAETLAQGVRYAGRSRHSGAAVQAVLGKHSFDRDEGSPPLRKWNQLAREVRRARDARVVLSSEFLADAEASSIPRVLQDLGEENIHVVLTLRPLSRLIGSQWQQYVKGYMTTSFEVWLEGVFHGPRGTMSPSFWRRHRHDELIDRWAAHRGRPRADLPALRHDRRAHVAFARLAAATDTAGTGPELGRYQGLEPGDDHTRRPCGDRCA